MATTMGRYTLLRRVATGGMAEIWKAKAQGPAGFSKTVAIKKVLPHLVEDQDFIDMFIEEAKLVAELVHPNIVQVFDFGELAPREYFLAMEYVSGANVGRLVKRIEEKGGKLPAGVALYIVAEAAKGLGAAHRKTDLEGKPLNIVHRDVSPQNLLVSYGGELKVSDFGIAKATSASSRTAEGMVRGKLSYMSPEQANGKPLDGRSDLFALGIILWELLTGKRLFPPSSAAEIYGRVSKFDGLTPEEIAAIPKGLAPVVIAALHPDLSQRTQSMLQLETSLSALLGAQGTLKAREMMATMMTTLFDDERRLEATPTEQFASPDGAIVGGVGGGGIAETVISPANPISGLTLNQSKVEVKPAAAPEAPPKNRVPMFAALGGGGALVMMVLLWLGIHALFGSRAPLVPPTPVPTPLVATTVATTTPLAVAKTPAPTATPIAAKTATPLPVQTHVAIAATPTPAQIRSSGTGTVFVKSRPWVQVWIDGRLVQKETPLRDYKISAGTHQFRFINEAMHFDTTRSVSVPAGSDFTISIDVAKNAITMQ